MRNYLVDRCTVLLQLNMPVLSVRDVATSGSSSEWQNVVGMGDNYADEPQYFQAPID